jgi:molybdate transport system substrate-binding protein
MRVLAVALVVAAVVLGCGGDDGDDEADEPQQGDGLRGEILVSAAASLTESFDELARRFEDDHPGVDVVLDYGPSSGLANDLLEGRPGDVFAPADEASMQRLVGDGLVEVGAVAPFARNRIEIAVPAGNPGGVQGLDDLARDELLVGLCAEDVPCGTFARAVLRKASVVPAIDTNELDVKGLLGKIETDELDVGLVYHSDVVAAGDEVEGIEIPDDDNVVAVYPIAPLAGTGDAPLARAFVDLVAGADGRAVLEAHGFVAP